MFVTEGQIPPGEYRIFQGSSLSSQPLFSLLGTYFCTREQEQTKNDIPSFCLQEFNL